MTTFHALVTAHIFHINVEQTICSSNLTNLLDEAIATVIPNVSEEDYQHVGGQAMMAVRIKGGSDHVEEDDSEDERPSMVLRNGEGPAEGVVGVSLSADEDATDYEPAPPYNPDDDEIATQRQPVVLTAAADVRDPRRSD